MCFDITKFLTNIVWFSNIHITFVSGNILGFRFGNHIFNILRHFYFHFLCFYLSKKMKGAFRGLRAPFIVQGTYLEPVLSEPRFTYLFLH